MKILALEKELAGTTPEGFQSHLKAETQKIWELQQQNVITLPLVQANLIEFEIIPLKPYPGFKRIFDKWVTG